MYKKLIYVGFSSYSLSFTGVECGQSECYDINGRKISPGFHFVPGPDTCTLCVCENGNPKWCKAVLCSPPQDCKSFRVGASCCEFICLDDTFGGAGGHKGGEGAHDLASSEFGLRLIAGAITAILCLSIIFFSIHRLRQRKIRGRQGSHQLHSCDSMDGSGSIGFIAAGSIRYLPASEEPPALLHYSLWKPSYFSSGGSEAPPPYEEAVAAARLEAVTLASSAASHHTSLLLPSSHHHHEHRTIPLTLATTYPPPPPPPSLSSSLIGSAAAANDEPAPPLTPTNTTAAVPPPPRSPSRHRGALQGHPHPISCSKPSSATATMISCSTSPSSISCSTSPGPNSCSTPSPPLAPLSLSLPSSTSRRHHQLLMQQPLQLQQQQQQQKQTRSSNAVIGPSLASASTSSSAAQVGGSGGGGDVTSTPARVGLTCSEPSAATQTDIGACALKRLPPPPLIIHPPPSHHSHPPHHHHHHPHHMKSIAEEESDSVVEGRSRSREEAEEEEEEEEEEDDDEDYRRECENCNQSQDCCFLDDDDLLQETMTLHRRPPPPSHHPSVDGGSGGGAFRGGAGGVETEWTSLTLPTNCRRPVAVLCNSSQTSARENWFSSMPHTSSESSDDDD